MPFGRFGCLQFVAKSSPSVRCFLPPNGSHPSVSITFGGDGGKEEEGRRKEGGKRETMVERERWEKGEMREEKGMSFLCRLFCSCLYT